MAKKGKKKKAKKKALIIRLLIIFAALVILAGGAFVSYKLIRRIIRKQNKAKAQTVSSVEIEEQTVTDERIVKVKTCSGEVSIYSPSLNSPVEVANGVSLNSADEITVEGGAISVQADNDKHVDAKDNAKFVVNYEGTEAKGEVSITLMYGTLSVYVDNDLKPGSNISVVTPNSVCILRGTSFKISYNPDTNKTDIEAIAGKVDVTDSVDGTSFILAEKLTLTLPYDDYGYFDDNVAPVFHVAFPQYAIYEKGGEDNSYPTPKFDPMYGITAEDEVDGDCTEAISYELIDKSNGVTECKYTVSDKAGNEDSFSILYTTNQFLETTGDLHTVNNVEVQYTMRETDD